ncbi:hypothetical protein VTO73DRAFT_11488 [Trametes versicolor]
MPDFDRPQDFDLDGRLGRCKVCTQGDASWTKLGNLRSHEKQKTHKENVARALELARQNSQSTSLQRRRFQAYVEDCPEIEPIPSPAIPWFAPPRLEEASLPATSFAAAGHPPHLSFDMQDALSGAVDFSCGEMPAPMGISEVTLEDVLSGAGLLENVLDRGDTEERPPPPSEADAGWASLQDEWEGPDRPVATAEEMSRAMFASHATPGNVFPYPNLGMMKTDILFSSPTIRFSRSQKEAILAWGKQMGATEVVPSLYGLDKFQDDALESVGDPTEKVQAPSGNVFYMNSIPQALARDYAHAGKRRKMHLYPEFSGARVKEAWNGSKWLVDVPDSVLTPMTRVHGKDFFINELAYCTGGRWFIPTRFFEFDGALWAKGRHAADSEHGLVVGAQMSALPCSHFQTPWPDIEARAKDRNVFAPSSAHFAKEMPHPDRALAEGLEVECPPLIVFIDDVSGNSTKQWNVHYSCYVSNAALPRAELEKDGNIRFVATSPHASPMEIICAICDALKKGIAKPYKVWDAVKRRHVLIRPWILFLPGDNPMQAELCSHIGLQGNHFCRMCHGGGDHTFKASNEGFASLMTPGRARTVSETREAIMSQLAMATHASAEKSLKSAITASGVKDSFAMPVLNQLIAKGKILWRSTPARKALTPEMVNKELYDDLMKLTDVPLRSPLLDIEGLDVHQDTPVEPLHTHLLGVVKYFWAQTVWVLEKQGRFLEFQARLNSLSRQGLKVPNIMADYMCRYRGALIGKHFKTLSQVMAFAVCGLVDDTLQKVWSSIGHLTVLIWETEIVDIKVYTKELREVIQDTIDFAAALSPGLLTEKNKFHILAHLPDHIDNRQAPSRDIAKSFANQDRCRHIMSGGYWCDKATGEWVQAGEGVLRHVAENLIDARLLGLTPAKCATPGDMTLLALPPRRPGQPQPQHPVVTWKDTESSRLEPPLNAVEVSVGCEVIITRPPVSNETTATAAGVATDTLTTTFASVIEILRATSPNDHSSWVIHASYGRVTLRAHLGSELRNSRTSDSVLRVPALRTSYSDFPALRNSGFHVFAEVLPSVPHLRPDSVQTPDPSGPWNSELRTYRVAHP